MTTLANTLCIYVYLTCDDARTGKDSPICWWAAAKRPRLYSVVSSRRCHFLLHWFQLTTLFGLAAKGGSSPVVLGGKGGGVRASCQVIWIIFPTSAKFTYQICNFACGYRCRCGCSCSWSRAKVVGIYSQLYVCLSPLPSPTAAACLAAAKDAFRACFWLDSDSTWMKMFARIRGINKCTPCASQFMYVCVCVCLVWCVCVCALASCRLCPCLECLSKALACVWTAIWIMNLRKLRKLFIIDVENFQSRLFM